MFQTVKSNKISEYIVGQIRRAIFEGRLKPGDRLASEKELIEKFGVSKATLREAMRSLEVMGLLEIRKGAQGGAFVTEVNAEKARDSFTNFLVFKNLSLKHLAEVRLVLEAYVAERAAKRMNRRFLHRLEQLMKESEAAIGAGDRSEFRRYEIEFHRALAETSGNALLVFIIDFIETLLAAAKEIVQPDYSFSKRVLAAHKEIYRALVERNPESARKEMIRHVKEVERGLLAHQKAADIGEIDLRKWIRGSVGLS